MEFFRGFKKGKVGIFFPFLDWVSWEFQGGEIGSFRLFLIPFFEGVQATHFYLKRFDISNKMGVPGGYFPLFIREGSGFKGGQGVWGLTSTISWETGVPKRNHRNGTIWGTGGAHRDFPFELLNKGQGGWGIWPSLTFSYFGPG